jgi:hypothetical protein
MQISDYQINASVRSILARHCVDLQRLTFGSFRGTVRLNGEFCSLLSGRPLDLGDIEAIQSDIKSLSGVKRVYI